MGEEFPLMAQAVKIPAYLLQYRAVFSSSMALIIIYGNFLVMAVGSQDWSSGGFRMFQGTLRVSEILAVSL